MQSALADIFLEKLFFYFRNGPVFVGKSALPIFPFVYNSAEKGSVFHAFPIKNGMISQFLLIIPRWPSTSGFEPPTLRLGATFMQVHTSPTRTTYSLISPVKKRLPRLFLFI